MYYKIDLYMIKWETLSIEYKPTCIDKIIVEKKTSALMNSKEIMTNLKIAIKEMKSSDYYSETRKHIKLDFKDYTQLKEYGFCLYTLASDYVEKNKVTEEELDNYIENFESKNKFKRYYDEMKIQDRKTKKKIKKKGKEVRGKYE